ncbi:MAG: AmmeMemoRadiSam system protein B [Caldilineae bacterium]|nr:MAG: AmmeMemoRadiSam system protein B [Caldilineae bacterium]
MMPLYRSRGNAAVTQTVRPPAVAGTFYPALADMLENQVKRYLAEARLPDLPGVVRAVIAPHAGYIYSGPVAAYSFKALALDPATTYTFYLMGPAHYLPADHVALAGHKAFSTPLGTLPVAEDAVARLQEKDSRFSVQNAPHGPEHCLEVELPFLQVLDGESSRVVPMLLVQSDLPRVAEVLAEVFREDPNSRLIVSSDLSHYHPYQMARALDTGFLEAVVAGDIQEASRGEACGKASILVLMHMARALGWQPHLLDYRNSGDTAGDRSRVVGYAAVAYTEG